MKHLWGSNKDECNSWEESRKNNRDSLVNPPRQILNEYAGWDVKHRPDSKEEADLKWAQIKLHQSLSENWLHEAVSEVAKCTGKSCHRESGRAQQFHDWDTIFGTDFIAKWFYPLNWSKIVSERTHVVTILGLALLRLIVVILCFCCIAFWEVKLDNER